jgi:U3 small nucleolar RNA-associated protein 7
MFCHKAPLSDISIDREGRYMATAGLDGFLKIWDLRQYRLLHAYKPDRPVTTLDISDTGLLALGLGRSVQVLKDAFTRPTDITYLQHELRPVGVAHCSGGGVTAAVNALASSMAVCTVSFRPFEDVLSIGHSHGISSIVVPGAGEANFDSFEANPFMNPKQRREAEVKSLLYKLQPEMIGLDESFIGTVDKEQTTLQEEHREVFRGANKQEVEKVVGHKARGRNKISAKLRRKQKNVIDASVIKLREKMKKKVDEDSGQLSSDEKREIMRKKHGALARFFPKQSNS